MLEVTAIQTAPKEKKLYDGPIDGIAGKATTSGIETALTQAGISFDSWPDERRQIAFEQLVYRDAKIEVGVIDGLVGEATRYARSVWEARQKGDKSAESWRDADLAATAAAPVAAPKVPNAPVWPRQSEAEMIGFYGARDTNQAKLTLSVSHAYCLGPVQDSHLNPMQPKASAALPANLRADARALRHR